MTVFSLCRRNLQPGETQLRDNEEALLDSICKAYYLPKWCSINDYEELFTANGLQGIKTEDWSEEVAPFWGAVIKSALTTQGVAGLFKAGLTTLKVTGSVFTLLAAVPCMPYLTYTMSALTTQGAAGLFKAGVTMLKVGGIVCVTVTAIPCMMY